MQMDASGKTVQCVVVTPERTLLDATFDYVVIPLYDGELGVLPGRAPLIGKLGPGELRTTRGNTVERMYVDGGFAQVRSNVVTVLTPRALKIEEIDQQAAAQLVQTTPHNDAQAKAQQRARIQLRVARHTAGQ
jgi:F-type H+-transporting ATPase subunit epsilon